MVAVIVCEQHGIAAPIFIRYPRNSQGCRNKDRIEGQFIAENMTSFSQYMELSHEVSPLANIFNCIPENLELCRHHGQA